MKGLIRVLALVLGATWTILAILLYNLSATREQRVIQEIAMTHARTLFQEIVDFRSWCSDRGGVYVPANDLTPPNPYLRHPRRDIETVDGEKLTLVNPAYMTRQVGEVSRNRRGFKVHITSLDPLRPGNEPQTWEVKALRSFKDGSEYFFDTYVDSVGGSYFRYMEPLVAEYSCLGCHSSGSRQGDILGGISLSFPISNLMDARAHLASLSRGMYVAVWLLGLGLVTALVYVLEREADRSAVHARKRKSDGSDNASTGVS